MGAKGPKVYVALVKAHVVAAAQPKFEGTNSRRNLKTAEYFNQPQRTLESHVCKIYK